MNPLRAFLAEQGERRHLDRRRPGPTVSYAEAMTEIYEMKYTGPLTVQFAEGVPKAIEVPVAFRIDRAQN